MLVTLKIIHLLAMAIGIGTGVAKGLFQMHAKRLAPETAASLMGLQRQIGHLGVGALGVLWVTGLILYAVQYAGADLGAAFHLKMAAVVAMTGGTAYALWLGARARKTGTPPPSKQIALVGSAGLGFAVLAVVFASLAFG